MRFWPAPWLEQARGCGRGGESTIHVPAERVLARVAIRLAPGQSTPPLKSVEHDREVLHLH
eukprot:14998536-Alexandrium_andersonii.AAC.1